MTFTMKLSDKIYFTLHMKLKHIFSFNKFACVFFGPK